MERSSRTQHHARTGRRVLARDVVILSGPAAAVAATLIIAWEMRTTPLTAFDGILSPLRCQPELYPSIWLSVGHAIVPVIFLIANLVEPPLRRQLRDRACAGLVGRGRRHDRSAPSSNSTRACRWWTAAPACRIAAAFFAAMILGQLAGSFVFDRTAASSGGTPRSTAP